MTTNLIAASLVVLWFGTNACAHRLDEYLQATTISLEKDRVRAQIRLTPGVAVLPFVMATIDSNADRMISANEQNDYAERVLSDLSLAVDGDRMKLQLIAVSFPKAESMKEGLGEIRIDFAADVPRNSPERKLVFENRHLRTIATYLVNCLVPEDRDIQIKAQNRNYEQSLYQLDYVQNGVRPSPISLADARGWLAFIAIALLVRLALLFRKRKNFKVRQG